MNFNEKFRFLLDITNIKNTDLAKATGVDTSVISLYKNGKRKNPRNSGVIHNFSDFFSSCISADYQRQALSEAIGVDLLFHILSKRELSDIIYKWLMDEDLSNRMVESITSSSLFEIEDISDIRSNDVTILPQSSTNVFTGSKGKLEAFGCFFNHILSINKPDKIYFLVEDDWNVLFNDPSVFYSFRNWILRAIECGFSFCQITRTPAATTQFYEEIIGWIPAYLTGKVESYYYPHLRDNLYEHTMLVLPGHITLYSNTLSELKESLFTVVTTNQKLVSAKEIEFKAFLKMCRSTMSVHLSIKDMVDILSKFAKSPCDHIQKNVALSPLTFPFEIMNEIYVKNDIFSLDEINEIASTTALILENREYINIDICPLADAESVKKGIVPLYPPFMRPKNKYYYSPKTYIMHLKAILKYMDINPNYYFIPKPFTESGMDGTLVVYDIPAALLVRYSEPSVFFYFKQPYIVQSFKEYLHNRIDSSELTQAARNKTRSKIIELINELEN